MTYGKVLKLGARQCLHAQLQFSLNKDLVSARATTGILQQFRLSGYKVMKISDRIFSGHCCHLNIRLCDRCTTSKWRNLDESAFVPRLHLYAPSGALVGTQSGSITAQLNTTLTVSGTYALIIRDDSSFDQARQSGVDTETASCESTISVP